MAKAPIAEWCSSTTGWSTMQVFLESDFRSMCFKTVHNQSSLSDQEICFKSVLLV